MKTESSLKLHDITVPFSDALPVWPGDPVIEVRPLMRTSDGDSCNASQIVCPSHCGTHVDPPFHFDGDGLRLDQVPLERWVGPCQVIELTAPSGSIEPGDLESANISPYTTRLLCKTSNSALWGKSPFVFETEFVALSLAAAHWMVDHQIQLIGVDYLSFEHYSETEDIVHRTILGAGLIAIEGLNLSAVSPGFYDLVCLPLKLVGGDGAPARVILVEQHAP